MEERILGIGYKNWLTTHGLRGNIASLSFDAGHTESLVCMLTGHRDPRSLRQYQNFQVLEGKH